MQTGVQKIKLIVQAEVADVKASPVLGVAFTRKLSVQINNPIFYKILKYTVVYHHYEFRQIKPLAAFL